VKPFIVSVTPLTVTSPVFRCKMCLQNVILGLLYVKVKDSHDRPMGPKGLWEVKAFIFCDMW
jgi:hypothetical protein